MNKSTAEALTALADKVIAVMHLIPEAEFEDGARRFYTCEEDPETLSHTEPGDAVQEFIDQFGLDETLPAEVIVHEYAPRITNMAVHRVVDDVMERLDDDYGDPNGEHVFEATPLMLAVESLLYEVFQRQYRPWVCSKVSSFPMPTELDD